MRKILYFLFGIICFALVCIGLLLPIIPQIPFFVAAMLLFAKSSSWIKKKMLKTKIYKKLVNDVTEELN